MCLPKMEGFGNKDIVYDYRYSAQNRPTKEVNIALKLLNLFLWALPLTFIVSILRHLPLV